MKIWIDADAVPVMVKDVCFRASDRLALDTVLVANQRVALPPGYSHLATVRVDHGADEADRYIAEHAESGDVAVTADIPLAARAVKAGADAIGPTGRAFTEASIGNTLATRTLMDELRSSGLITGGPKAFTAKDRSAFLSALDVAIVRLKRAGFAG